MLAIHAATAAALFGSAGEVNAHLARGGAGLLGDPFHHVPATLPFWILPKYASCAWSAAIVADQEENVEDVMKGPP